MQNNYDFVIIGAGFSGLTLALRLAKAGKSVLILERDANIGGLASDFTLANNYKLERFYHHWFSNDIELQELVNELGLTSKLKEYPSRTGMYFNKSIWRLSSPLDLIKFKALKFPDRIRLGIATLLVRRVKDWRSIEGKNIREWLEPLCGTRAYKIVWEPLVNAKFSEYAEEVSAAWMWKKIVLRGGSRSRNGHEKLLHFEGGFGELVNSIEEAIIKYGGQIRRNEEVTEIHTQGRKVTSLVTNVGEIPTPGNVVFTGAPSQLATIIQKPTDVVWVTNLKSIKYLANICLILLMKKSLSETYWLNVNDPGFPFVGIIEHTNLVSKEDYGNLHVVYLSRYISQNNIDYNIDDSTYFKHSVTAIKEMFPEFQENWVVDYFIWRTPFAQPITTVNYSQVAPKNTTPYENLFFLSMAQIYPEDRGTNYAIKQANTLAVSLLGTNEKE